MSLIKLRAVISYAKRKNVVFLSKFCIRKCCIFIVIFTVKYLLDKDNAKFVDIFEKDIDLKVLFTSLIGFLGLSCLILI